MCPSPAARPSPRASVALLAEVTASGGDVDQLIWSWSARQLIKLDGAARSWPVEFQPARRRDTWLRHRRPSPDEAPLLSMASDGHRREAAVQVLASRPGVSSDRLLALRLGDHVPEVREAAWQALRVRPMKPQLDAVVPVLVALQGRAVAATALVDYTRAVEPRLGHPLWREFLAHPDRETRRWAVREQIGQGMTSETALLLLDGERDLLLMRELVEVAVRDGEVARRLLTGRSAVGRRRALEVLPAAELSAEQVEKALIDRSAMVRRMAAFRAADVGIDARSWYRERWVSGRDSRALAGVLESGGALPRPEVHGLLESGAARLQRLGVRFLARLGVERVELPLLWRLLDSPAASQVVRTLTSTACWSWEDLAGSWERADERLRRRLWRLLSSRGGWDEVRAHLLAATEPRTAGLGRAGLNTWERDRASRMYHAPTPEQRAHLVALLETADIPVRLQERIRFGAGLG
ncbi:MAG: hypothetical protein Q4D96_01130 [Propionibacteriaceae bacterium]|nr:hypothetical protein [Propionibacteriaceae bacterium]